MWYVYVCVGESAMDFVKENDVDVENVLLEKPFVEGRSRGGGGAAWMPDVIEKGEEEEQDRRWCSSCCVNFWNEVL